MQNDFKMDNELYHFGIKGQRWGVRRYQNPDGSLTALGKKKYGTKSNFEKVQAAKKAASGSKIKAQLDREKANARTQAEIEKYRKKAAKKLGKGEDSEDKNDDSGGEKNEKKKTGKQMSNEELRTATERINLERNYAEAQKNYIMTNQQLAQLQPQKVSKGKEFAKKIWKDAVEPAVVNAGKKYLDNMLKDALGLDKNPMAALEKKAKEAELKKKIYESESARTKAEQQAYNFERNKQANLKSEKDAKSKETFENAKKQVEDYYNNVYSKTQSEGSYSYTRDNLTSPKTYTKPISNPALLLPGPNDKATNTKTEKGMGTNTAYSMIKDYSNNKSAPLNSDKAASVVFNDIMKSINSDYKSVTLKTKISDINSNYKNSESVNSLITDNSKLTVKELMKKSGYNKFYDKTVKHSDESDEGDDEINQNELYHHGIKGQRWGVRRYQNPDGSLTAAGKQRQKQLMESDKETVIAKGTKIYRISSSNKSDTSDGKIYVNASKEGGDYYITSSLATSMIMKKGKMYVHEYVATKDIKLPDKKTMEKVELGLLKDKKIQRELVDSLMKKGLSREEATSRVQAYNAGKAFVQKTGEALAGAYAGGFVGGYVGGIAGSAAGPAGVGTGLAVGAGVGAVAGAAATVKNPSQERQRALSTTRVSYGDKENKIMNETLRNELSKKGYRGLKDYNDRRAFGKYGNNAAIIFDSNKNIKLSKVSEVTAKDYGIAYAKNYLKSNPKSKLDFEDLVKDGEKRYKEIYEEGVVKREKEKERKILLEKAKKKA